MDYNTFISLAEAYRSIYEGKVAWDDPKNPLRSGWTPREKARAKMERTGVEDSNKRDISNKDLQRYGGMKSTADKMDTETKQSKGLFGKKDNAKPHEFPVANGKSRNIARALTGTKSTTMGQVRRSLGANQESGDYQTPINIGDDRKRTKSRWGGPNPN